MSYDCGTCIGTSVAALKVWNLGAHRPVDQIGKPLARE
jgi:hypothetical protein